MYFFRWEHKSEYGFQVNIHAVAKTVEDAIAIATVQMNTLQFTPEFTEEVLAELPTSVYLDKVVCFIDVYANSSDEYGGF